MYLPCILASKKRYVGHMYESPKDVRPSFDAKVQQYMQYAVLGKSLGGVDARLLFGGVYLHCVYSVASGVAAVVVSVGSAAQQYDRAWYSP